MKRSCYLASLLLVLATGNAFSQAPPIGQGGAAPGPPVVQRNPWLFTGGGDPIISVSAGCGLAGSSGPAQLYDRAGGNHTAGFVFLGADYVANAVCTVTFATGFPGDGRTSPACVVSSTTQQITDPQPGAFNVVKGFNNTTFRYDTLIMKSATTNVYISWICYGTSFPGP
jgi:hypothetical protein